MIMLVEKYCFTAESAGIILMYWQYWFYLIPLAVVKAPYRKITFSFG
jgi:hypothetical protein